ncbi:hypothetical protein CU097_005989 [Rhizopus azygosporus]|uniref:Uncharacterized protein n=1 Tax=Rhizopus azygosporus TaxID=86630 RepID=A0A367IZR9_RHIAZ|nr:hypothetical protein CU097_005989 [Rhizopus azygosporus]CEG70143.1 hypothetical protein RMATCC62417_06092 [Rhizopus microsporus]
MSDLPPHKGELTPKLQEQSTLVDSYPDYSNPYAYPPNNNSSSIDHYSSSTTDPQLQKLKSSIWKKAGQIQSTIGGLAQIESWRQTGQKIEEEAEREYREAEERMNHGEPSRIHGEYNRLMGFMSYAVGHIAGDPEMQARGGQRSREGEEEIDKSQY